VNSARTRGEAGCSVDGQRAGAGRPARCRWSWCLWFTMRSCSRLHQHDGCSPPTALHPPPAGCRGSKQPRSAQQGPERRIRDLVWRASLCAPATDTARSPLRAARWPSHMPALPIPAVSVPDRSRAAVSWTRLLAACVLGPALVAAFEQPAPPPLRATMWRPARSSPRARTSSCAFV
jgi:hypothetical protein